MISRMSGIVIFFVRSLKFAKKEKEEEEEEEKEEEF